MNHIPIGILKKACNKVEQSFDSIPFKYRGITITNELIKATMEILNSAPGKILPQNCRNAVKCKTPDGLDKRIKEALDTDLRAANIISDVLQASGVTIIVNMLNTTTGRDIKGTKLSDEWSW